MARQNEFSTNLGLSREPELDQKQNPQMYAELLRLRRAVQALQSALDVYTGALLEDPQYWNVTAPTESTRLQNISRVYLQANEDIPQGRMIGIVDGKAVLGITGAGKWVRAISINTKTIKAGEWGHFILFGLIGGFSGLEVGPAYYVNNATGLLTTAYDTQVIGFAISQSVLFFKPDTISYTPI